ncbi:non-canonical purine NTP diphosphatase [Fulvivirgaceae bacterium PWU4]|uniref:dITP/XTP pyrophosphatase n=1 Tax=Chryseosolibacter histidini TaxID=2782349 RepID=A0AAP2DMB5_9BACT|nr:non-canonical purine NTP diphosphatase [Chryseosolibacter histidini]MBT1698988.1 non-canonical purine NTP diphosphatase [Chryseosolibacter histidini]
MDLCFASNNNHKLSEIRPLLEPDFAVLSLAQIGCHEELPETQATIEGNSQQKAEYVFDRYHVPCFADDTGLEVEALGNAPGVYSARYAGEHKNSDDNINLLLKNLEGKPNRKARFRTVITLAGLGGLHFFEGVVEGTIITTRKGTDGFGYDPIFQPEGFTRTFAEMSIAEKNEMSHRARATQKLIAFLKNYARK